VAITSIIVEASLRHLARARPIGRPGKALSLFG